MNSGFKQYRRTNIAEMRPYIIGENMSSISISNEDIPEVGGMIARNPKNHNDQWYVAQKYFKENFELINIGDGYYAFPLADCDCFYVVEKKFWDENQYVNDYCEIINDIPGFEKCMESCIQSVNEKLTQIESENLLASLGFTILECQD
jgi:hypothetical protein